MSAADEYMLRLTALAVVASRRRHLWKDCTCDDGSYPCAAHRQFDEDLDKAVDGVLSSRCIKRELATRAAALGPTTKRETP